MITKAILKERGWVEKSGVMVLFSNPRMGWKEDGTLIIGYREHPDKVKDIETLNKLIQQYANN